MFILAYGTAFGETLTIAHFPYYSFKARSGARALGTRGALLSGGLAVPCLQQQHSAPDAVCTEQWAVCAE